MDSITRKKTIQDRLRDIKNLSLLNAADEGDHSSVEQLIRDKADVNFVDTDGNTALHCAVGSGNSESVQLLLSHINNANIENNENETPLDIASRHPNERIIDALGEKVVNESLEFLREAVIGAEADNSTVARTTIVLTPADKEIENAQDKIRFCLEAIEKLRDSGFGEENVSYEQANVLIYFIEAFALEGSGDEVVKAEVKQHFSRYYSEQDRKAISDARDLLLKKPGKIIGLQDVRKFIKGDVCCFFEQLKKYVQGVHDKLFYNSNGKSEIKLLSFFNVLVGKDRNIGEAIDDIKTFLKANFEKMIAAAYGGQKITSEELFSFTMNFYPALQKETNGGFKELADMRNKLIHQFHKYGYVEFGNAIYSLRSRLFKYYYAQEALKIINAIEPDDKPEVISRNFGKKLTSFQEQFQNDYGTEQVVSQEDAKGSLGYVFSHSVFPEKEETSIEELVDLYLKFMTIIDREKKEDYDWTDIGRENDEELDSSDNEDKQPCQHKELNDVNRREIFEKFCRLKRIKKYFSKGYDVERQKFRDELTQFYGVNGHHFDNVCNTWIERNKKFNETGKITVEEIAKTINTLKKLKDSYKLSNQVIISLYDHLFGKHSLSLSEENESLLKNLNQEIQQEIKNELPRDKTLEISFGNETFRIRSGKVVSNMLKTFYNAYHKYQVEFNVEEIFNDDVFLNYVAQTEVRLRDIAEQIDSHLKPIVFLCGVKKRESHKTETADDITTREVFGIFRSLKKCRQHFCDQDYRKTKEILKKKFENRDSWLNVCDFDRFCELFIENDSELDEREIREIEKVKRIINNLKSLGFPWQITAALCEKTVDKRGNLSVGEDLSFLKKCDQSRKEKVKKQLEKIYAEGLIINQINMVFRKETLHLDIWTIITTIINALKEEQQFKRPSFIYMVVKKLLRVDYCTPYIVKLITTVGNDDVIEKDDLLKLLDVLLKNEEGLYIKHLRALLGIESRKLDLYEELCKKIIYHDVNIENMSIIFSEPDHVKEILNILKEKTAPPYNAETTKFVELLKEILKLLNNIAYEMCRNRNNDVALNILDSANSAHEKLICNNFIAKTNLSSLETICQIGRIKNRHGTEESDKSNKAKLHEEALNLFRSIHDTLRYKDWTCNCLEEREIRVHEIPLFFLVSSEVAYTKVLLGKYEESCDEHEKLYQEVVTFVLDLPMKESLPDDFLNAERYSEIEGSKNYQALLSFSKESKKYLDVLNIKSAVAYTKVIQGKKKVSEGEYSEALGCYYKALGIYKDVYALRKRIFGPVYRTVISSLCNISYVYSQISYLWLKRENEKNALVFCYVALQKENKVYETRKYMFWTNHIATLKSRGHMVFVLRNVAHISSILGRKMRMLETITWNKKSHDILEKLYHIEIMLYGERHKWTMSIMYNLGSKKFHLGRLEEAKAILEKLHEIQIEQSGDRDENERRCRKLIAKINVELGITAHRLSYPLTGNRKS